MPTVSWRVIGPVSRVAKPGNPKARKLVIAERRPERALTPEEMIANTTSTCTCTTTITRGSRRHTCKGLTISWIVPELFLPVARMTVGCLSDVVGVRNGGKSPVRVSGNICVTVGNTRVADGEGSDVVLVLPGS